MASRISNPKSSLIYPASPAAMMISDSDSLFEFDESEIWTSFAAVEIDPSPPEPRKWNLPRKSTAAKPRSRTSPASTAAASMPVNVPDWSKILKQERDDRRDKVGESFSDEEDGEGDRVPPHEYLARTRAASFSVHEGIGRTLKGRDLRRVRNAIWKRVGFED